MNQIAAVRFRDEREDQIAMRIHVVDGEQQFAEAGLSEVLREHFGVTPAEIHARRRLQLRRPAHQVPHDAPAVFDRGPRGQRRAHHAPPERSTQTARLLVPPAVHEDDRGGNGQREQHQPRQPRRERVGCERRLRHAHMRERGPDALDTPII
jgi:hypothetical protein